MPKSRKTLKRKIEDKTQEQALSKEEDKNPVSSQENFTQKTTNHPRAYDHQTKLIIVAMILIIASIFLAQWFVQQSKKFEYNGLNFYEEKEGTILYYKSLLGYATANNAKIPFILKLRNDPRVLDKIPLVGTIKLKKNVILSLSPEITNCSDTYVTMLDFSRTLAAFNINASAATTDKSYSKEHSAPLADCNTSLGAGKTVIVMKEGAQTKITQENTPYNNCYTIEINNCEIQKSFERFLLGVVGPSS